MCRALTEQTRANFLEGVSRSSLPAKLQGLLDATTATFIPEMIHQKAIKQSHPVITVVLSLYGPLKLILFVLAFVQNIVIVVTYSTSDWGRSGVQSQLGQRTSPLFGKDQGTGLALDKPATTLAVIGTLIFVTSVLLCSMHMLQYGKLKIDSVHKRLMAYCDDYLNGSYHTAKERLQKSYQQRVQADRRKQGLATKKRWTVRRVLRKIGSFFKVRFMTRVTSLLGTLLWVVSLPVPVFNIQWLFYLMCSICALAGLLVHPFFFAIHMLDIVNFSRPLQNVLRAVTKNFNSLFLTAAFIIVWTYLYAVVGLEFFQIDYQANDSECYDLFSCWLTIVHEGLRTGDLGNSLTELPPLDQYYYGKIFYSFTFWFFVITIFLNLFFGIIIDTCAPLAGHAPRPHSRSRVHSNATPHGVACALRRQGVTRRPAIYFLTDPHWVAQSASSAVPRVNGLRTKRAYVSSAESTAPRLTGTGSPSRHTSRRSTTCGPTSTCWCICAPSRAPTSTAGRATSGTSCPRTGMTPVRKKTDRPPAHVQWRLRIRPARPYDTRCSHSLSHLIILSRRSPSDRVEQAMPSCNRHATVM